MALKSAGSILVDTVLRSFLLLRAYVITVAAYFRCLEFVNIKCSDVLGKCMWWEGIIISAKCERSEHWRRL